MVLHFTLPYISTPLSSGLRSFSWGVCSDFLFLCMECLFFFFCLPLRFALYMWFIATWTWCLGLRLCFYLLLFQYLFCLGFSEPLNLWFDAFHCFWKFLSIIFIHICSTAFSFSCRIPITYKLDNFIFFTDVECTVLPPTHFLLCFGLSNIYWLIVKVTDAFLNQVESTDEHGGILYLCYCVDYS